MRLGSWHHSVDCDVILQLQHQLVRVSLFLTLFSPYCRWNTALLEGCILHYMAESMWTLNFTPTYNSIPKPQAFIYYYNKLHSSGKVFHHILDPGCRDLVPLSSKSLGEVVHCCWVIRPGFQFVFQFIPKGFRSGLCAGQSNSLWT